MDPKASLVFEVSWEVCNKVGGIYTVVRSKVPQMLKAYKENYIFIGPYFPQKAAGEFMEEIPPDDMRRAFERLRSEGIECHYGSWMIPLKPKTILVDFQNYTHNKDNLKGELWNAFKVDSLNTSYFDFDEPVIWSGAVARVIQELEQPKTVAHFHEWLAGAGILFLKLRGSKVATVFTTHATILGRSISSAGEPLYDILSNVDPETRARELGIQAKFSTEKAAAQNAQVFTPVSEITAMETEKLLGRKPDVLLPNGLEIAKFPSFEEATLKHVLFKRKIKEFIIQYFFPYYKFNLDNTRIFFICGRHETRDKGIDVFTQALSRLNDSLKESNSDETVVAFFWVPGNIKAIRPEIIEGMTYFKDFREALMDESDTIKEHILYDLMQDEPIDGKKLMGESLFFDLQKKIFRFRRKGTPPLSTHELYNEHEDDILGGFRNARLNNLPTDRVKVIYYPVFLNGADRLLDLGYYEGIMGCHLGVFPSYYEPWGYTPLETGALGVSSVTTDLAGFGRWIKDFQKKDEPQGIYILDRMGKPDEDVVAQLTKILYDVTKLQGSEKIHRRIEARRMAALADWSLLAANYIKAHNLAIDKI